MCLQHRRRQELISKTFDIIMDLSPFLSEYLASENFLLRVTDTALVAYFLLTLEIISEHLDAHAKNTVNYVFIDLTTVLSKWSLQQCFSSK